jgi:hypothetical protein
MRIWLAEVDKKIFNVWLRLDLTANKLLAVLVKKFDIAYSKHEEKLSCYFTYAGWINLCRVFGKIYLLKKVFNRLVYAETARDFAEFITVYFFTSY